MPDPLPDPARLKRLRMRAWRRGTREMDLILGPFADEALPTLGPAALDAFERLLAENDHDLYAWLSARITGGGARGPAALAPILGQIARHAAERADRA